MKVPGGSLRQSNPNEQEEGRVEIQGCTHRINSDEYDAKKLWQREGWHCTIVLD
jgi:hypothetical protein